MYSRADLSRTGAIVVALFFAAISTNAVAREFRAADTRNEDYPTVQALRCMGPLIGERSGGRAIKSSRFMPEKWNALEERSRRQAKAAGATIVTDIDHKPFEAAMAVVYARAQQDPAAADLIARIRKVE